MISFEEARRAIREQAVQLRTIQIPLAGSLGHYTASAISSLSDSPRFTNSAVDGYAFHFEPGQRTYKLVGSVAAGEFFDRKLIRGECVRIFTGAMLPDGADTCVMQEYVEAGETTVTHSDASLKEGSNVRFRGEELSVGDALIPKGVFLNAQGIGLLAACGVDQVHVYAKPKVKVIVTGSEFIERTAEKGRIFNSNGPMLSASFAQLGYEVHVAQVRDDKSTLKQIIAESLDTADLVVTTGGVSVGDHDHVVPICDEIGLEKVFHGVAQKPGKPMYFGKGQGKHLLGLPGNPRAVMVGFHAHVRPLIAAMQGTISGVPEQRVPLAHDLGVGGKRTELLAASLMDGALHIRQKQNSHMLSSLVDADVLAILPAGRREFLQGDMAATIPLK